jgi:hypothetical protein
MKNIHVLPTDKPSRLVQIKDNLFFTTTTEIPGGVFKHIYITSDEEIKEDDWCYDKVLNIVFQTDNRTNFDYVNQSDNVFKIILTTDQDLINDGIQEIDETFLEWFVKNPSCESVKITKDKIRQDKEFNDVSHWNIYKYKIIIPKEEPKPIHQQIIDIVGGEDRFKEIAGIKPKQETLKKVEENIDREEWIHFFKNNSKEEILEYLIKYKFPL